MRVLTHLQAVIFLFSELLNSFAFHARSDTPNVCYTSQEAQTHPVDGCRLIDVTDVS
jgi:hypothetical protein